MNKLWRTASYQQKLTCILITGLVLRLIWVLLIPVTPVSDSVIYATTAKNIALHGVYGIEPNQPFSYWPVGTAAIYAIGYKLFGMSTATVIALNLVASLGLVYTSALLAQRWFDERVALVTAGFLALWPSLIFYVTVFASEIFFSLFVNLSLLAWRLDCRTWVTRTILSGLMLAIATYIRPITLLFPLLLFVIELVRTKTFIRPILAFFLSVLVLALAIAPWSVRNTRLHNGFVLISTNGGPNLWMGNNPNTTGAYMPLPEHVKNLNERDRAQLLGAEAKQYILEHPGRTATMFLRKLFHTHLSETIAVHWNAEGLKANFSNRVLTPLKLITQLYWTILLILGLFGVIILLQRALEQRSFFPALQEFANTPLACWLYFAVLHAIIVSQDRYHFPSIPFIAMLGAMGVSPAFKFFHSAIARNHNK